MYKCFEIASINLAGETTQRVGEVSDRVGLNFASDSGRNEVEARGWILIKNRYITQRRKRDPEVDDILRLRLL